MHDADSVANDVFLRWLGGHMLWRSSKSGGRTWLHKVFFDGRIVLFLFLEHLDQGSHELELNLTTPSVQFN
jgi:hypothetical protein